jgi:hypothetical protein
MDPRLGRNHRAPTSGDPGITPWHIDLNERTMGGPKAFSKGFYVNLLAGPFWSFFYTLAVLVS